MDLFELNRQRELSKNAPLADRLRPNSLDKYIGCLLYTSDAADDTASV